MKPLRVLIVSEMSVPYATGGGETRYALLARELAARGHTVTWLSMRQRSSPPAERIDGVLHLHVGPRLLQPPVRSLLQKLHHMAAVVWHLLRHRYDIVDCQPYAPLPAAWLACRLRGLPLVAAIHDTSAPPAARRGADDQWLSDTDRRLAALVEGTLYRLPYRRIVTGAHAVREDLVERFGVPVGRISVAANGVDVARLAATPPDARPCDLVFAGRLVPHKHPEHVLQAAAQVQARRLARGQPGLRIKLVGGGPLRDSLQEAIRTTGLADAVVWQGEEERHAAVVGHIRSARVLVLPSTREGFGLVLTEAMACGTAVLAYDIPPVRETLGPTLHDALVPSGNVEALAAAIERLLDDDQHHAAQVAAGRARVAAAFDLRDFAGRVLAAYEQALTDGPTA